MERSKRVAVLPGVLTIVFIVWFAAVVILIALHELPFSWVAAVLLLLPVLVMGLVTYLVHFGKIKPTLKYVLSILLALLFLVLNLGATFSLILGQTLQDKIWSGDYARYLARSSYHEHLPDGALDYFPSSLTDEMTNVQFLYRAPFLQGGETLLLSYELTDASALESQWSAAAKWQGSFEEGRERFGMLNPESHLDEWEALASGESFRADVPVKVVVPVRAKFSNEDARYYVFAFDDSDPSLNHGRLYYAAVNASGTRVVLVYENW